MLLRKSAAFSWKAEQSKAFNMIKEAVCDIRYLGFFDRKDRTKLIVDASPEGLGAVLLQENKDGQNRIISFASKALTDLERKYFQTEREALAIVWGVERFSLYLLGTKFVLITDCKALKYLFSPRSRPCPRIERWVLRIQSYNYEVKYEPGVTNLADALSRLSIDNKKPLDTTAECYINYLLDNSVPEAVTLTQVADATRNDKTLQELLKALRSGSWSDEIQMFKCFKSEIHSAK